MKIAIVKLSALGDIVHAMVVLQFIKKHNPKIIIDWVVDEGFNQLLELNPNINKVHSINLKKAKKKKSLFVLFNELRKVRQFSQYDVVIDMQGLIKSAVISRLIPSYVTIGFDKSSLREKFASFLYNKTFQCGYDENVIERNIALIAFALELNISKLEIMNKVPFLHSSEKYVNTKISSTKKNVLLIPGASVDSKIYPTKKFAELAKESQVNFLVIWGNEGEKVLAEKIKGMDSNINICDKLSIDSLISLIHQVDVVIGSDTGPTHMAWALNVPSITLFGSTPGYRNTYVTKTNLIIESKSKVDPLKLDRKDNSIKDIGVKEISIVLQELLNQ